MFSVKVLLLYLNLITMDPNAYETGMHVINPDADPKAAKPKSVNYSDTKDPNVKIGKYGVKITKDDLDYANSHGYAWQNLDAYADYLGGWAHKLPVYKQSHPYYRTYPTGQISAADMALLEARDDPKVNAILQRNIAGQGEIPQYGEGDSDYLKALIKGHPVARQDNFGDDPEVYDKMVQTIKKGTTSAPVVPVQNFIVGK